MSYQVNFRLFIPDCEYWEAENIRMLRKELHDACMKVIQDAGFKAKNVGMTAAEVAYLSK